MLLLVAGALWIAAATCAQAKEKSEESHEGFGELHYDLMCESSPGSALMTWRAPDWPPVAGDELIRIGDHRRDYLEYQGPVSNNRGSVRRVQTPLVLTPSLRAKTIGGHARKNRLVPQLQRLLT